ncbi:50S ribosomal protein L25 [Paenibacillus lactis]|uniref:Large ribosomal subunit protein bL25 n=2 Tax=Bacilli TaxID=91061 RepID=A0ABS4F585_9BACL|nr:50S ribosomal protein L25 [Paenibacillus lactis]MBP1891409.1 large subunit ribosomal protein L25 [Paenibacillus lactis]HAF98220.1 50S ribosomal protein L25 [Paenibacillus lactis]
MAACIHTEKRPRLNSSGLRNLRQKGRLPGVVFGKNAANEIIHISMKQFEKWLKRGASGFIELQMEGDRSMTVLLEDLQRNPITGALIHVDFQLVQTGEIIRTKLGVKFVGTPIGTKSGGVVQIQDPYVEVEALPKDLPTTVELDISAMEVGDTLFVKDLTLPPEVTVISGDNELLVSVSKP